MNKKNLALLILITACAVAIGLLIYYLIFFNFNKSNNEQTVALTPKTPVATLITNTPKTTTATTTAESASVGLEEDLVQQDAGQVAKIFVERFGTYSNQVGVEQFADLKLFITAKMQSWVNAQVAKILGNQNDYKTAHVVRTQAVTVKVASLDKNAGTASVTVSARRTDQTGEETAKISNPEIKLQLIKAGKRWQVDSVVWQ